MRSIILICLSVLIIGIIFAIILILIRDKCNPGDPSCDNNIATYQQNKYNNKWLNNNSYVITYPNDTSRYFMLRGKRDFNTINETATYQPVIDSIDNCANYLTLQTDDNNYFIESSGLNSNNLNCHIKHIDYDSNIRGDKINNNSNMITIINGINSNDTFFYKGMIDYALLDTNGDICINKYNKCIADNIKADKCMQTSWEETYNTSFNRDIPCGYVKKNTNSYKTKNLLDCAKQMKQQNTDMATFNTAALPTSNNCYYRNFPSGNPYNYLIFRK